jgi:hypothetical protein
MIKGNRDVRSESGRGELWRRKLTLLLCGDFCIQSAVFFSESFDVLLVEREAIIAVISSSSSSSSCTASSASFPPGLLELLSESADGPFQRLG